jgi:hypothetical protein
VHSNARAVSPSPALRLVTAVIVGLLGGTVPGPDDLVAQEAGPGVTSAASPVSPLPSPGFALWTDEAAMVRDFFRFRGESGARVLQGGIGLLAAAGGPLPASPSTAGQRLHGSPRFVADVGLAVVRVNVPALEDSGTEDHDRTSVLVAPRLTVAAGVFEGFSPAATVGGVGSVDVVGELRYLPLLAPEGIDGGAVAWGLGVRLGILRESFTLPGVTLVGMHRRTGTTTYRGAATDVNTGGSLNVRMQEVVEVSPSVTSLRAVVGKDLLAVGVNAGVQRDWIRGDARVEARRMDGQADFFDTTVTPVRTSIPVDRTTWFVGLNRTWVVTQASLELGWSPAAGGTANPMSTGFPEYRGPEGAFSGAISFRITY